MAELLDPSIQQALADDESFDPTAANDPNVVSWYRDPALLQAMSSTFSSVLSIFAPKTNSTGTNTQAQNPAQVVSSPTNQPGIFQKAAMVVGLPVWATVIVIVVVAVAGYKLVRWMLRKF